MHYEGYAYIVVFFLIYFAPWLVAKSKKHSSSGAIGLVNLFFGWTILGWVIAAAWASCIKDLSQHIVCSGCREMIHSKATVCPHCHHATTAKVA